MKRLLAALALVLCAPLNAQDIPAWRAVDGSTGQIEDIAGLEQLARDFPDSANVRLRLLNAQLEAGDQVAAMDAIRWLSARGHSFGAAARMQVPALLGSAYADEAAILLAQQPEVITTSTMIYEVPAEAGLVESVFLPPGEELVLVTSVSRRSIYMLGPETDWTEIRVAGANDLSGLAFSSKPNAGWIASANIDGSLDDQRLLTGLIEFDGEFDVPTLISAPDGVAVSDIAIGPDGTVYASDPIGGGIYRAVVGAKSLEELIAPGTFRSPQGLAVSEDGKRLYLSDYRYGLAVVALETKLVSRLASDVPVLLDGIDGLWLHRGELIAVQNGTSPMRISGFCLSEDGTRVTGHRVLEQAHPDWTEPLGGNISGGMLYYVGTGQWDRYDRGVLREGMMAIPTAIRRLPLAP